MIPLGMFTSPIRLGCGSIDATSCASPWLHLEKTSGIDPELLTGDVAGGVGGQKQHGLADVLGLDVGNWHRLDYWENRFGVFSSRVLQVGPEGPVHRRAVQHVGVDVRRVYRVHPDGELGQRQRKVVDIVRRSYFRER